MLSWPLGSHSSWLVSLSQSEKMGRVRMITREHQKTFGYLQGFKWGNQIGSILFPFTIALRDDSLDYVREAKAAMDRKKASLEASYSYFMCGVILARLFHAESWAMGFLRRLKGHGSLSGGHRVRLVSQSSDHLPLLAVEGQRAGAS
ncbi:hypothetical protein QYF36_017512 [Acer negundo]|nr:hypothetical protein QYF36_017512 [Acer negundo]